MRGILGRGHRSNHLRLGFYATAAPSKDTAGTLFLTPVVCVIAVAFGIGLAVLGTAIGWGLNRVRKSDNEVSP
jgi:hypothetical protein